jgi:hypothetical protein
MITSSMMANPEEGIPRTIARHKEGLLAPAKAAEGSQTNGHEDGSSGENGSVVGHKALLVKTVQLE